MPQGTFLCTGSRVKHLYVLSSSPQLYRLEEGEAGERQGEEMQGNETGDFSKTGIQVKRSGIQED